MSRLPVPAASSPAPSRPQGSAQAPRPRSAGPVIDPIRVLRQHVWRIMIAVFLGAGLGVGLNYLFLQVYPLWSSQVLFEIRSQLEEANALTAKDIGTEDTVVRLAQTEVARLTSKDILERALSRPEIQKTQWANAYRDAAGTFVQEEALLDLEDELRAGHRRGTQIFYISWMTRVPEDGPIVLNALAKTYVQIRDKAVEDRFNSTLRLYTEQRDSLDRSISQQKERIQKFIAEKGITSLTEGNSANQRTLEKLKSDIAQTTADLSIAQSTLDQAQRKQNTPQVSTTDDDRRRASQDPVLQDRQRDAEDLAKRKESVSKLYRVGHATRDAVEAEHAAAVSVRDRTESEVLSRNRLADLRDATNRVDSFSQLLKKQESDLKDEIKRVEDFTSNMAEMRALQDQIDVLQQRRSEVGKTIQEIELARSREESKRVEVIQEARKPREITFPKLKIMVPVTAVLLAGLYVLVLFVRELLDQRVKYPSDLGSVPGRILGAIPALGDDPAAPKRIELVVSEAPNCILAENYRQVAVQVAKGMHASGAKTLMVASPMPGSGTTSTVLNIAACEAAVGHRVLVVGANMRRPGLMKALGLPMGTPGLGDVLAGAAPESVVVNAKPNIDVMGAGTPGNRVFERLNGSAMDGVLQWARERYDLVLVDAPPSVVAGETLTLANKVDASMIVARAWQDQRGLVMKFASQLMDSRSTLLGTMLNGMRMTAGGYLRKNALAMAQYAEHTAAFGKGDAALPEPVPVKKSRRGKPGKDAAPDAGP